MLFLPEFVQTECVARGFASLIAHLVWISRWTEEGRKSRILFRAAADPVVGPSITARAYDAISGNICWRKGLPFLVVCRRNNSICWMTR